MRRPQRKAAPRKPITRRPARKVAPAKPYSQDQGNKAIVLRVPVAPDKPWQINQDEIVILKNAICKGATDEELKFCLAVARRHKLDPFRGQIWFVKRKDRTAAGGERWIPIVGIGGMLHIAARDHKDFGSNDEPEFGSMHEVKWTYFQTSGKIQAPEWAKVTLWKKGLEHPTVAKVFWDEIYPDVGAAPLVRQMPRLMLGKCALAQALRRAYPATDGLYIKEEFQGREEFTPSGREIVYNEPAQLEEAKVDTNWQRFLDRLTPEERERELAIANKHTPEQRAVLETKMAKVSTTEAGAAIPIGPEKEPRGTPASTRSSGTNQTASSKAPQVKQETPAEEQGAEPSPAPCLFVVQLEPNRYEIMGRENLIPDLRNILRPYWDKDKKQVIVNDEQLDAMKFEYDKHGIQIRPLEKMNG